MTSSPLGDSPPIIPLPPPRETSRANHVDSSPQRGNIWVVSSHTSFTDHLTQTLPSTVQITAFFTTGKDILNYLKSTQNHSDSIASGHSPTPLLNPPVDLLIISLDLSDMTGIELLISLHKEPLKTLIPIIVIDALSESDGDRNSYEIRQAAFQAGAIDYISTPLIPEEIKTKIRVLIGSALDHSLDNYDPKHLPTASLPRNTNNSSLKGDKDTHDRTRDLQALATENHYLRIILDNLPQQVFWKDKNLYFLGCNKPWADAVGLNTPKDVIGKTDFDLTNNPTLAQQFQEKDRRVLKTGESLDETMTKVKIDPDGTRRWLDVTRHVLRDEKNEPIGVLGVINDVTRQRQTEENLRLAEEKYREIFENAVEGLFQISLEGEFLSVNPALAYLYGYESPEEMIQEVKDIDTQIYVQPKRRQEILAYLQQFSELTDFESRVQRKNGTRIWVSENIRQVLDSSGQVLYLEGSVKDITEKRQAEMNLRKQRQQSERLLLNILPQMIAQRLKQSPGLVADDFSEATVLFADIVGFTEWASQISVSELVQVLNNIFSDFDLLAEELEVEKIKTIGDAYMAVSGVPIPVEDHAGKMAKMALEMQVAISRFSRRSRNGNEPFRLRIGMHSGPVSAGVVGLRKFFYDLWGDTVNVASRMESQGTPGRIQVTHETYLLLKDNFDLELRGEFQIKGKGNMKTYWLLGEKKQKR